MRRFLFAILILGLVSKCSKKQPTETISQPIIIEGSVSTNNPINDVSGLVVSLKNDKIYLDSTNAEGLFNFKIETEGEYILSINDTSYLPFDSSLYISKNTSIHIGLKSANNYILSGKVLNPLNQPIWGLQVRLDGSNFVLDKTKEDGSFEFRVNDIGEYRISISSYYFLPFDSTILISNDTSIVITALPTIEDYFPLYVGNKWQYSFSDYVRISNSNDYKHWYQGTHTKEVINTTNLGDLIIYTLAVRDSGIFIKHYYECYECSELKKDTVWSRIELDTIKVIENGGRLKFKYVPIDYPYSIFEYEFDRYFSYDEEDEIEVDMIYFKGVIKRYTGTIDELMSDGSNSSYYQRTLKLQKTNF